MDGALGKIRLSDRVKGEASGPQLVAAADQNGQPGLMVGWQFTVWLYHDVLLGQDPVGVTVPVGIMLPAAELVEQVTTRLLEEARRVRHEVTEKAKNPDLPDAAQMMEALRTGKKIASPAQQ